MKKSIFTLAIMAAFVGSMAMGCSSEKKAGSSDSTSMTDSSKKAPMDTAASSTTDTSKMKMDTTKKDTVKKP